MQKNGGQEMAVIWQVNDQQGAWLILCNNSATIKLHYMKIQLQTKDLSMLAEHNYA